MRLPVEDVIDDIRSVLGADRSAVLQAPPGAGKTTLVPLALLNEDWLSGKKIVMLEPRRIAVRAAAGRMADLLGEPVGKTVGYQIRMERCIGPETRIEVITEGILTRRIQNDPALEDIGLIIFDEFHERNLNSDLGLALSLESREVFCENLRILVMSATIDGQQVSELMENAPVITSEGKSWPVETRYVGTGKGRFHPAELAANAASLIQQVVKNEVGDVLVFLPGTGEIKRVKSILDEKIQNSGVSVLPLFGNLTKKEQDLAIAPSKKGERKIVLATSIAETSITIEGVSIVIDSGFMRIPRYFSGTGMSRLETVPVTLASADQRRGRAGRTKAGICYRMWEKGRDHLMNAFSPPEILSTDLSGFVLELALWGSIDITGMKLLTPPPEGALEQAKTLLKQLGAIDKEDRITDHGKKMAETGIHPRLSHMMIQGRETGHGSLACHIAALLSERDFLFFRETPTESDITLRLEIILRERSGKQIHQTGLSVDRGILQRILQSGSRFIKLLKIDPEPLNPRKAGTVLALAYPDRIMKLRGNAEGRYLMAGGKGAYFHPEDSLARIEFAVAAELDGSTGDARVYLAAPYSKSELTNDFSDRIEESETIRWDKKSGAVILQKEIRFGALTIATEIIQNPDPESILSEMIRGVQQMGAGSLPWTKELRRFQARALFLYKTGNYTDFPDLSDRALMENADIWLRPFLYGISKATRLKDIDLKGALESMFTWETLKKIDKEAPEKLTVPSGSSITLKYPETGNDDPAPVLAVRLQELFGLEETPRIAGGRVPVMIHILSPAMRPVQVTRDLRNFWKTTYHDVKKELKGRYPKHYWPDDPFRAIATTKTKNRLAKENRTT